MITEPAGAGQRAVPFAYGTSELGDLCALAADGRMRSVAAAAARDPRRIRAVRGLRRLPVIEPRLTAEAYRRWQRCAWPDAATPLFGGHWAQAVVQTPVNVPQYLRGRRKQALRTNLRRAGELGVTAARLGAYEQFAAAAASVYRQRAGGEAVLAGLAPPSRSDDFVWYAAHAAGREEPVAIAAVAIFGDVAALSVMVGDPRFTRLGHARYLLHTFVLGDLAGAGIGHLVAGTVLRETAGNRYFQQLLGYRVCNLRPIVDGEAPGTRGRTAVRRVLMKGAVLGARPGQAPAPAKPVAAPGAGARLASGGGAAPCTGR